MAYRGCISLEVAQILFSAKDWTISYSDEEKILYSYQR
jgi:hypothetical protein